MKRLLGALILFSLMVPLVNAGISYQPDILPEIDFSYDSTEYAYRLEYKQWYLVVQPYAVYNNQTYTLKQIVPFIQNNYPSVTYRQVVNKFAKYHQWGYWLENLPPEISDNLQAVGYRLVETNIPLSAVDFVSDKEFNVSRLEFRNGFTLDFSDLEARYDVEINKTHIHVTGITGLTNIDLDPITYGSPIITVVGLNGGSPYTFWDVWNASYVNGWDVVFKEPGNNYSYLFITPLYIGDGSTLTSFRDYYCQVWFNDSSISAALKPLIYVKNNAYLTLGDVVNIATKTGKSGCAIGSDEATGATRIIESLSGSYVYLYSTHLQMKGITNGRIILGGTGRIWDCVLSRGVAIGDMGPDIDVSRISTYSMDYGIFRSTSTFNDIKIADSINYALFSSATNALNLSNVLITDSRSKLLLNQGNTDYLTNVESDTWQITWNGAGTMWRQYTVDLTVRNDNGTLLDNAQVILYDKNGAVLFSETTNNGVINTQTVPRGYYNQANGDTLQDYSPMNLVVLAQGYTTYNLENITLGEQIDWTITLQEPINGGTNILLIIAMIFSLIVIVGLRKHG